MPNKRKNTVKRLVDAALIALPVCLMAYQVTGEAAHEWLGIGITVLVIVHQALNAKWYGALLRGRYHAKRVFHTAVNALLLLSFGITAICGMAMSSHAAPFLYGMLPVSFARQFHLSFSHWLFVLMGLHLGLHLPQAAAKLSGIFCAVFCALAAAGLFFFLKNGIYNYLFFRVPFAVLDYEKPAALVLAEHLLMLLFFAFPAAALFRRTKKKGMRQKESVK